MSVERRDDRRRSTPWRAPVRCPLDNRLVPPILITVHPDRRAPVVRHPRELHAHRRWRSPSAIAAELVMARLTYGRWPHLASAYITGISVGILVRSPFLWPYVARAA